MSNRFTFKSRTSMFEYTITKIKQSFYCFALLYARIRRSWYYLTCIWLLVNNMKDVNGFLSAVVQTINIWSTCIIHVVLRSALRKNSYFSYHRRYFSFLYTHDDQITSVKKYFLISIADGVLFFFENVQNYSRIDFGTSNCNEHRTPEPAEPEGKNFSTTAGVLYFRL